MNETDIKKTDFDVFLEKSMKSSGKTEKELMQNLIVQEVAKSYSPGGCNCKKAVKK